MEKQYQIAVAGTGYVGMSIAVLLAQHHPVFAVDIIPEKVQMIQNRQSPIQDTYIEQLDPEGIAANCNAGCRGSLSTGGFCGHCRSYQL